MIPYVCIISLSQLEIKRKREQIGCLESDSKKLKYIRGQSLKLIEIENNSRAIAKETKKAAESESGTNLESDRREKEPIKLEDHEKNNSEDNDASQLYANISESEVLRRFRAKNQPVRLFGETDGDRLLRLRKIEAAEEAAEGQHNDFRAALAAAERKLLEENLKREPHDTSSSTNQDADGHTNPNQRFNDGDQIDTSAISLELLQSDPSRLCVLIRAYLKRVLREWDQYLDSQPEEERRTAFGRQQKAIQAQTTGYLKPFFRMLKNRSVAPDVLSKITEICKYMQEREYTKANAVYLRLSIGNAPWPIGVTMVGIHERSAREKICSSQVAHVLNDESQRKWIQSIKRLMTFSQMKYPSDDITMMVG